MDIPAEAPSAFYPQPLLHIGQLTLHLDNFPKHRRHITRLRQHWQKVTRPGNLRYHSWSRVSIRHHRLDPTFT